MNNKKVIQSAILILLMIIIGIIFLRLSKNYKDSTINISSSSSSNSIKSSQQSSLDTGSEDNIELNLYSAYSQDLILNSSEDTKIALFFTKADCETCNLLDANITQNESSIPLDVKVLKVDMESEKSTVEKYKITTAGTVVEIDKTGKEKKRMPLPETLYDLITELE